MVKRMTIAALALIGVFVALYLTLYKMGSIGQLTCTIGGCEKVNTSKWAMFLGLPVAMWGVGFYLVTFVVAFVGTTERFVNVRTVSLVLTLLSGIGVVFSAWLTYLELFVIHAICQYCVISAIIVLLIFGLSVVDLRDRRLLS